MEEGDGARCFQGNPSAGAGFQAESVRVAHLSGVGTVLYQSLPYARHGIHLVGDADLHESGPLRAVHLSRHKLPGG